jgi:hypothetical protein
MRCSLICLLKELSTALERSLVKAREIKSRVDSAWNFAHLQAHQQLDSW